MSSRRITWSVLLTAAGLVISAYLVINHYFAEQIPLACSAGGIIDCEQVTTSAESMLGPIPVAVLGFVWFAVLGVMLFARATRARLVWSIAGLVFVFYLVYVELFAIGAICLWCTVIHALVVVLFLLSVYDATAPSSG